MDAMAMDIDQDKVDQAVLALLSLGRLHQKGYITDPVGKAKSVLFTDEGLRESERLFNALFCRQAGV
jgi:hypothetical protein